VLADEVQAAVAVGVGPEPALGAVVAGAILVATGQVPERHGDVLAREPLPIGTVLQVASGAHPVLAVWIVAAVPFPIPCSFKCSFLILALVKLRFNQVN